MYKGKYFCIFLCKIFLMRKLFFIVFIFIPAFAFTQITDDFSDDEFSTNQTWFGDTSKFEIIDPPMAGNGSIAPTALDDDHVLRSKQNEGDAVLVTHNNIAYGEWNFSVGDGNGWNVSSTNDYFVILTSDDSTRTKLKDGTALNFNGYYLCYDGANEDQFILYKQTGTTEEIILDTDFPPTPDDAGNSDGYSIKITRDIEGLWTVFIDSVFEANAITQRGISVIDNTHQSSKWFGVSTNIANNSDTRVLYFDNLNITKDFDSDITSPTSQVPAGNITSISDTEDEAVDVFKYKIIDSGTSDGLPSFIDIITIYNANPANGANWTDFIQGAILNDGTSNLTQDSIKITNDSIIIYLADNELIIDDSSDKEITFSIYLNETGIIDEKKLQFYIDADKHNWIASEKGSGILNDFTTDVVSNEFTVEVTGTNFQFTNVPENIGINQNFGLGVISVDENSNIDSNASDQITIAINTGTGNLSSITGLTQNLSVGNYNWSDLRYDALGDFVLTISALGYNNESSGTIISFGDTNSYIESPGAQIPTGNISSLFDTEDEAISVFKFKITDGGSGDLLPTDITQIVIKNNFPENNADWTDHIAGIKLSDGSDIPLNSSSITDDEISIAIDAGNLQIADGQSKEIEFQIYLNSSNISDNDVLQFAIESVNHGFIADNSGSTFKTNLTAGIISNDITIDIVATELEIITQPNQVDIYSNFEISIQAIDENRNIDLDNTENVTLTKYIGNGVLSSESGLNQSLNNGYYLWNDLQYSIAEQFRVEVGSENFTNVLSDTILAVLPFYEDSFENGNLDNWSNTDDWTTSSSNSINGSYSLKHNLSGTSGESFISHPMVNVSYNSGTVVWKMILKNGNWDPTSTNKFGFYLMSNNEDLTSASTSGYAVGVNFSGSDDLLKLWKITNNSFTELISSSFDWSANDVISIEVSRSAKGEWLLKYAENESFQNLLEAGNTYDNDFDYNNYYGAYFRYSSTRAGEFWCDDIEIFEVDSPPFIKNVIAIDSVNIQITFSEEIEIVSAETAGNYIITPQNTNPIIVNSALLDSEKL